MYEDKVKRLKESTEEWRNNRDKIELSEYNKGKLRALEDFENHVDRALDIGIRDSKIHLWFRCDHIFGESVENGYIEELSRLLSNDGLEFESIKRTWDEACDFGMLVRFKLKED